MKANSACVVKKLSLRAVPVGTRVLCVRHEILRRGGLGMSEESIANAMFEHVCRPLAEQFQVSAEAMRIRLEEIGFLKRKKENTLF